MNFPHTYFLSSFYLRKQKMDIYFCPLFIFESKTYCKNHRFFTLNHNALDTKKTIIHITPTFLYSLEFRGFLM